MTDMYLCDDCVAAVLPDIHSMQKSSNIHQGYCEMCGKDGRLTLCWVTQPKTAE